MPEDRSVTFKPLKGGRYRCNRDRVKVKKGRTHAHRVLHTQDPKAMARLAAERLTLRLEKQAEAAEEERRRKESYTQLTAEEERRSWSREEAWLRFNQVNRTLRGRF